MLMVLESVDVNEVSLLRHPDSALFRMAFTWSYLNCIRTVLLHFHSDRRTNGGTKWLVVHILNRSPRFTLNGRLLFRFQWQSPLLSQNHICAFFWCNLILARSFVYSNHQRFLNFAFQSRDFIRSLLLFLNLHHLAFLSHQALNRSLLDLGHRLLMLHPQWRLFWIILLMSWKASIGRHVFDQIRASYNASDLGVFVVLLFVLYNLHWNLLHRSLSFLFFSRLNIEWWWDFLQFWASNIHIIKLILVERHHSYSWRSNLRRSGGILGSFRGLEIYGGRARLVSRLLL